MLSLAGPSIPLWRRAFHPEQHILFKISVMACMYAQTRCGLHTLTCIYSGWSLVAGPPLYYLLRYRCADFAPARERSHPCLSHFVLARCVFAESAGAFQSGQRAAWTRARLHASNFLLRPYLGVAISAAELRARCRKKQCIVCSHISGVPWS